MLTFWRHVFRHVGRYVGGSLALAVLFGFVVGGGRAEAYEAVKVQDGGAIVGAVTFAGTAPPPKKLKVTRDVEVCGTEPKVSEALLVSPAGGLQNVVVYLNGIDKGKPFSDASVELDQRRCWFIPHVQLVRVGEPFVLLNSDKVLHNFRTPGTAVNRALNKAQPKFKRRLKITVKNPDIIPVNCDIHEWMHAVLVVMGHPYYALTDATGAFTFSDVPPGRYRLTLWHEVLGEQTRDVEVTGGGESRVAVEFRGK